MDASEILDVANYMVVDYLDEYEFLNVSEYLSDAYPEATEQDTQAIHDEVLDILHSLRDSL